MEDWAIVGDRSYVSDKLQEYIGRLGINHLIVRGGLPGVDGNAQLKSHQLLLDIIAGF